MAQTQEGTATNAIDPRILDVQAERAAKTIRGTALSSLPWAIFLAVLTSDRVPFLGTAPFMQAAQLVVAVSAASLGAFILLHLYHRGRDAVVTPEASSQWLH